MITAALQAATQNADFIVVSVFFKKKLLMTYGSVHFDTFSPRVETEGLTLPGVFLPSKTLHIHEEILLMAWLTPKIHRDCHSPELHSMRSSKI